MTAQREPLARRQASIVVGASLFIAVLVAYGRVVGHDFVTFDDPAYVTENPFVLRGLTVDGILWALTSVGYAGNWHPLTWLSHMLDVQVFGLWPGGHHLTSVLLHALTSVLLFAVLRDATRPCAPPGPSDAGAETLRPALAAALFALHPLRVQSVAWVSERKDLLCGLLWVITIGAYVRYTRRPTAAGYALVFASMSLGVLAKPMIVTLPFVLLILDVWPLGRLSIAGDAKAQGSATPGWLLKEKIPLFALAALSVVTTLAAQTRGGALASLEGVPFGARLSNGAVSCLVYLGQLFVPADLTFLVPFEAPAAWAGVAAAGLIAIVSWIALRQLGRRPWLSVGWAWYVTSLLPVAGIVQVGLQGRADRYTYVPHIGLCVILAWGAAELARGGALRHRVVAAAVGLGIVALAARTWVEVGYWRDSVTLFRRAVEVSPGNYVARTGLAVELEAEGQIEPAIDQLREAVRIEPGYAPARFRLASCLAAKGSLQEALEQAEAAVRLSPHGDLALHAAGTIYFRLGRFEEAADAFTRSLQANPYFAGPWKDLGRALEKLGRPDAALEAYARAVTLRPDDFDAQLSLGGLQGRLGHYAAAIGPLREATRLEPGDASAHLGLGLALASTQDRAGALRELEILRSLDRDRADKLARAIEEY